MTRANLEQVKDQFEEHTIRCYATDDNWERLDRVGQLAREKGLTVAQIALAFVLHQPMNIFALIGAYTPAEFAANTAALDARLSPAEIEWLDLRREKR